MLVSEWKKAYPTWTLDFSIGEMMWLSRRWIRSPQDIPLYISALILMASARSPCAAYRVLGWNLLADSPRFEYCDGTATE